MERSGFLAMFTLMSLPDQPVSHPSRAPYSKPSEIGGKLIRNVIAQFKKHSIELPITKPVVISVSAGIDSMVLAHLVCTYGRKIAHPSQITLLHFDHGWRKESGNEERDTVQEFARTLQVKFIHEKLKDPTDRMSSNLEEDGRLKRQEAYARISAKLQEPAFILTGHHQTDAVESMLWRFLRGEFDEFRQGIKFQDSNCLRPLLNVTREQIEAYAASENVVYHADPSNEDQTFYRAWVRKSLMPLLETHFEGVQKNLAKYLTKPITDTIAFEQGPITEVEAITGFSLNRAQRQALHQMTLNLTPGQALSLPGRSQIRRTREGFFIEKLDESDRRK
jgi:tRNA(Ile)-lysidine synthetase-like protein